MQTANNVKLGDRLCEPLAGCLPCLFQSHGASVGLSLLSAERAKPARRHTDVRRIDVPIHVEVRDIAMHALTHQIRHPADGKDVSAAIQGKTVIEAETLSCLN